jgi:hypothetical protein
MIESLEHRPLHPTLPLTTLTFPVAHGHTSSDRYESSAIFIRYDTTATPDAVPQPTRAEEASLRKEFLFFGDVETGWRKAGEQGVDVKAAKGANALNAVVWEEAAASIKEGRLVGIFVSLVCVEEYGIIDH